MQIIQVQRGSIEARNSSPIKLQRGELFINNINQSPELLAGLGDGKYERVGGTGTLSFAGVVSPEDMTKLLNGTVAPTRNGVYVLKGGDLNLAGINSNWIEPNSEIKLFNGYSLTESLFDGDIVAFVKNGALGDQNAYGFVKLLSEKSLKVALDTKADLDPATGKVLLSQLPDTVTGGMDYQGTWNKQSFPTKNAGRDNDTAIDPSLETHEDLHKGDYWAYNGSDWDISALTNVEYKGSKENDVKFFVKAGDLIVYNGNGKWGIIDNTDAFIGIKINSLVNGESAVLDGVVVILDTAREDGLMETVVAIDGNGVKVSSPNAALIPTDEVAAPGTLYKEKNGNKVLTPSGISEDTVSATIDESNAQLNLKSTQNGKATEIRTDKDADATTIQVLPKKSGYLLNSNSVIDCGEWTTMPDGSVKFTCDEGEVSSDFVANNEAYQAQGTLSPSK